MDQKRNMDDTRDDTNAAADAVLRDAFEHRYGFATTFPGFTARARFGPESDLVHGDVSMRGAGTVDVTPDVAGADVAWLVQELRAMSRLCWPHDYAVGEGRFRKSLVDDADPLGPMIVLHDDPHQATFRVTDGRVTMMTRRQGGLVESVRIERWHVHADGRVLPARWIAELRDAQHGEPKVLRVDRYWDLYKSLAGELLPMLRRVVTTSDTGSSVSVIALSGWAVDGIALDAA
jgi:hypothetical protein